VTRGLSSTITTALASNGFRLATLVEINVGSSTFYLTDYGVSLTDTDARPYTHGADIIEIDGVTESGALKVNSFTLTLTGADKTYISAFLQNDYIDKRVLIKRAIVDATDTVTASFVFFDGRIVTYQVQDNDQSSEISLDIASHWADFEKIKNRRTNLNSQQVYFPSDMGFQYASKITKDLRWGRKG